MALTDIMGKYEPSGLAGGFAGGLKQGADLGNMFANTANTRQQMDIREQKLPWELAQSAADVDTKVMANDLTRAVQTPEILAQKGANAMSAEQFQGLDIERKMELFPFEKAKQLFDQLDQGQIKFVSILSNALKQGSERQLYQQTKGVLSPEQDKQVLGIIQEIQKNPAARAQYAKDMDVLAKNMTDTRNRSDEKTWQERWLQMLKGNQGLAQANASNTGNSSDKMSIDQRISHYQEQIRKLRASGIPDSDPRVQNYMKQVVDLNTARSKEEGMVIPQGGGVPSSYTNYGTSFSDVAGPTPAAQPNIIKLK